MSGLLLKLIALLTMTIDHTGAMLMAQGYNVMWMRVVGRVAFPIYAFLIAEGVSKTRNAPRYVLRLLLFALLSELPFNLFAAYQAGLGARLWYPEAQNVFCTLALGAVACRLFESVKAKGGLARLGGAVAGVIIAFAAEYLHTDYGFYGVLVIFLAYAIGGGKRRVAGIVLPLVYMYLTMYWDWNAGLAVQMAGMMLVSGAAMLLYNGRRGGGARWMKWLFYAYYPLHLLALVGLFV